MTTSLFKTVLFSIAVLLSIHHSCAKKAHLNFFMHEFLSGPNATLLTAVNPPNDNSSRGSIAVIDDKLREGQDDNSTVIGRTQDIVPVVGFDGSLETLLNLIFTDGKYNGSTIALYGRAVLGATIERPVVGGTGMFRMAKGYSLAAPVYTSATKLIYEFNVYVWYKEIK